MSNPWQLAEWPISSGDEISWRHFEDLRRYIYIKRFGRSLPQDYENPVTNATWATFVDSYFPVLPAPSSFPLDYWSPGWWKLFNVAFKHSSMDKADLFSCYYEPGFTTRQALIDNPPIFPDGTFNSGKWRYAADNTKYRDFDEQSGRRIVRRYTMGSGDDESSTYLSDIEAYRYLPKSCRPNDQQHLIQYSDTDRKIPHLDWLELNWQYVTQPSSLGPNYTITGNKTDPPANSYYETKIPFVGDAEFVPLSGREYAMPDGDPGGDAGEGQSDTLPKYWCEGKQAYFDPKLCYAYQNQVEQIVSLGEWYLEVDESTPWGSAFVANYNHSRYPYTPTWPDYVEATTISGDVYRTRYGGYYWESFGLTDPPSTPNWWKIGYNYEDTIIEPTHVSMNDERWGCNGSGFELALFIIGNYDWYFCTEHKYWPAWVRENRYLESQLADPPTEIELEGYYPTPAGTWRRTHKYTFGRPRGIDKMLPGDVEPDKYHYRGDDWNIPYWPDFITERGYTWSRDGAGDIWLTNTPLGTPSSPDWFQLQVVHFWPGTFTPPGHAPGNEEAYLTEEQIAEIKDRHEAVPDEKESRKRYEMRAQMLNDLWLILNLTDKFYADATVVAAYKQFLNDTQYNSSLLSSAYSGARASVVVDMANDPLDYPTWNWLSSAPTTQGITVQTNKRGLPYDDWSVYVNSCRGCLGAIRIYFDTTTALPPNQRIYARMTVIPSCSADIYTPSSRLSKQSVYFSIGSGFTLKVPVFNNTPFAGANDVGTGLWETWGGKPDGSIKGRNVLIPLALSEGIWNAAGNTVYFPIHWATGSPIPLDDGLPDSVDYTIGSALLKQIVGGGGIILEYNNLFDLDLEERHLQYTIVAEDDEKFNDEGELNE